MSDAGQLVCVQTHAPSGTDLVCGPHKAAKVARTHLRRTEMHVAPDGGCLVCRQAKSADIAEDADGAAAVPMEAQGLAVMGRAYVVQQRPQDDAVAGEPAAVGERKLARLQGVTRQAARHVVMGVAAGSEEVALAKIVYDRVDALAVSAAQQAQGLLSDLFVRHDFWDLSLIYTRDFAFSFSRKNVILQSNIKAMAKYEIKDGSVSSLKERRQ